MRHLPLALCLLLVSPLPLCARAQSHLMRHADVHGDRIVFTYEDDLWLAPATGGQAHRLTSHPGLERYARFSPDGRWIAFSGEYDGNTDVYVMEARGGVPRRLTFHPSGDQVLEWFPDGQSILFRARREYPFRAEELYRVATTGGQPQRLPVDRGGLACPSPEGNSLAYNRITRETATWKRYQGGMAQDIWIADFGSGEIRRLTDWEGTDNYPMWWEQSIVFASDRDAGTLNLFRQDVHGGPVTQLTHFTDYDVKYPGLGDGRVVFQYGEELHLLDLRTGKMAKVPIQIPSDRVPVRPEYVAVEPTTGSFSLSPSGGRLLLEARGEILNLAVEEGDPVALTRSSRSRERNAVWSPDGRWVAFVSDRTGEEQVYLADPRGEGEWHQLTETNEGFLLPLRWSPDSRHLLYGDRALRLNMVEAETGRVRVIDQGDTDDAWERWGIQDYAWSPCGRWVAYSKMEANLNESLFLHSLDTGRSVRLTDDSTTDWSPSFDPEGRYLWFLSNRTFHPVMGFQDQNHVFLDMGRAYLVLLRDGEESPYLPDAGLEPVEEPTGELPEEKPKVAPPTVIDLEGIQERVVVAEGLPAGNYFRLEATADGFLVLRKNENEFLKYQAVTDETGGSLDLLAYDLEEDEAKTVLEGIANYHLSASGKKLVYRAGSTYGVVEAGAEAKVGDGAVSLDDVRIRLDRREEFAQIFEEAWRIQRDWFYDENMHGVDWAAIFQKYQGFVGDCGNRGDLNYLIGEMIGELNIGHTYVWGGDEPAGGPRVAVGLLGVDLGREEGADYYRIQRILPGVSWDPDQRSPLAMPGCKAREGDYLIAIDGEEITTADNPWAFLADKEGRVVTLTTGRRPSSRETSSCRVMAHGNQVERNIRYRDWVERNRAWVEREGQGRVGYFHLPDMGEEGLIEFGRGFYPQCGREALILDERYNGGGFVGDMIVDRLERVLWGITVPREGITLTNPERVFHGPIVVLVNEDTGSNGEYFATAMQLRGLATIVGMRTWGGAVGIEPHQGLVDGGVTTPPQFGLYGLNGQWLIEGVGVVPDVQVQNQPADVVAGRDEQLETALRLLLERLQTEGDRWAIPPVPAFPDKRKP